MVGPKAKLQQRPAESGAIAGALALLICHALGVNDPDVLVALGIVIGFLPALITWIVVMVRGE